jgi:2-dehydropantoate 2-reductase
MALSFAVLGAGAFGSLIGGRLAQAGQKVVLIGRKDHMDAVRKRKLAIDGVRGKSQVALQTATSVGDLDFEPDVWVLGMKLQSTSEALSQIAGKLDASSILLSFQNGMPIDTIARHPVATKTTKILAAVTAWAAELTSDGAITQTSDGEVVIGGDPRRLRASADPAVQELARVFAAMAPSRIADDIYGHLWVKLLISSLYSVLAVGGLTFGDAMTSNRAKRVAFRVWTEGYDTAQRLGIKVETYLGQLQPEMFVVRSIPDYVRAGFVLDMVVRDRKSHRPSVLQDLEKGKATEIPFLNGYIVEKAREVGVPTPMSDVLMRMVHDIERKVRGIGKANIALLERALIFGADKIEQLSRADAGAGAASDA